MAQLSAYIHFINGECRQAMEFYQHCLGGELKISTYAESPIQAQIPANMKEKIIHSRLETQGMVIVADDMIDPKRVTMGTNISLYIQGDSTQEIETYFAKLSEGAKAVQPLTRAFFGAFGILTDKFGIGWILQTDKP